MTIFHFSLALGMVSCQHGWLFSTGENVCELCSPWGISRGTVTIPKHLYGFHCKSLSQWHLSNQTSLHIIKIPFLRWFKVLRFKNKSLRSIWFSVLAGFMLSVLTFGPSLFSLETHSVTLKTYKDVCMFVVMLATDM